MSINATGSSYISPDTITAWMEAKVNDSYSDIKDGMDLSGHRTDAEKALNEIKNQLTQMKTNGKDASDVTAAVHQAITEFGDEFPDVKNALEDLGTTLDSRASAAASAANSPTWVTSTDTDGNPTSTEVPPTHVPEPVHLQSDEIDGWTKGISDAVDGLSKDDQLGIINLNQSLAQVNQTTNTASAIADSRNKTLDAIINRIG